MPNRRTLIVLLAVCVLMPQKASAADWMRLRSANFTFEGNVGEQDLRAVAQRLEQFRTVFALMFPSAKLVTPTPVTVLVFRRAGDIKTVAPRFQGKPVELAGFAASSTIGDSISICLEYRNEAYSAAYHEYAHLLIRNALWNVPLWLNEGLAEYYSTFEMSDDGTEAVLGRPLSASYIELLRRQLLPIPEILAADEHSKLYNSSFGNDRYVFYGESWLLVHYLLHGSPDRKREFEDFVRRLMAGLPAAAAFDEAFPHPEKLGTELSDYIHQGALRASGIRFDDPIAGAADFTITPMSAADAEAAIGLELVRQRRLDEAKTHLELAASRDPQTAAAQTGLGLILALRGKTLEALPPLRKGAELADDDAMAHYALGYVALQCKTADCLAAHGGSEAAAREFRRAVALVPRFPEALMYLGAAEEAGGHIDAAERHILEAVAMLPGREDYRLKAGEVYIRQENEAKAQEMLGPIAAASPNESSKARARTLLGNLATLRASREAKSAGRPDASPPAAGGSAAPAAAAQPSSAPESPRLETRGANDRHLEGTIEATLCRSPGTVVLVVRDADGLHRFSTTAIASVRVVAYGEAAPSPIGCDAKFGDRTVYVTYRPGAAGEPPLAAGVEGRLVALEFLPKTKPLEGSRPRASVSVAGGR